MAETQAWSASGECPTLKCYRSFTSSTPELNSPVDMQERRTSLFDEDTSHFGEFHMSFYFCE